MRKSSTWEMTIYEEEDDILEVQLKGPSKKIDDLILLEILLRGLKAWDTDVDFKEGKMPKEITKTWIMPLSRVKAKLNPIKGKKVASKEEVKDFDHAIKLYREFNGVEPTEIVMAKVWLPDEQSPLVALGEGECPFVGYTSGKTNKKGELDTYIHHFGEDDDGKITKERPRIYVTVPPKGHKPVIMIMGGEFDIETRLTGGQELKWLVG
tara:strand:- start:9991 stop:10617 length:627 start_codon:yes stop_codon:yes gene_type:complete